jgi:hypothetical protein
MGMTSELFSQVSPNPVKDSLPLLIRNSDFSNNSFHPAIKVEKFKWGEASLKNALIVIDGKIHNTASPEFKRITKDTHYVVDIISDEGSLVGINRILIFKSKTKN